MRGTVEDMEFVDDFDRFIPAHAGNSSRWRRCRQERPVHPRACGEQSAPHGDSQELAGSSPRMRGTVQHLMEFMPLIRFIPAHAGNRAVQVPLLPMVPVHPRACGEQIEDMEFVDDFDGSSPRMRGTGRRINTLDQKERFIPAHAGNRGSARFATDARSVHPRACGEQSRPRARNRPDAGSSPRMRGTASGDLTVRSSMRFIPAHAGNSLPPRLLAHHHPVHPRACGEQWIRIYGTFPSSGSSPRMRGTGPHGRR